MSAMKSGPKPKPIAERFWARVAKGNGCWNWTGYLDRCGRGSFSIGSRSENAKRIRASRMSWVLTFGEIPTGMFVCHTCDQPACVRPDHLFLGTQKDNMQDAAAKKRLHNRFNSNKTHCKRGHEYSSLNTRVNNGKRTCKICAALAQQRFIERSGVRIP